MKVRALRNPSPRLPSASPGSPRPGEALASGEAVMLLGSATGISRAQEPIAGTRAEALEWPVYLLGRRVGVTTSAPRGADHTEASAQAPK